uniref:Shelterin complex subunit TPP1/Est3 domain-containing protein n=1 Tax=Pelusios castaneus TaxID=367368 RepID=A0A8C8SST0_9SAUR
MREEEEQGELSPAGLIERHVSGLRVCYLSKSTIFLDQIPECEGMQRSEDEKRRFSAPKVYVLQPWILNLLMKYGQLDPRDPPLPGHVLRVVSDSKATDPGTAAILHLSDGSYYIRVVVTTEAAKCVQLQSGFASIIGKIIIMQKYTVCFQEETKAEECEFYLSVQRFLVLPLQRQRMESLNCNQEPSILQKIKELWQKGLSLKTISSSGTSVSQLMIDMGQSQLRVLKQNVEECLDLLDPSEVAAIGDTLPVSKWVAERKRETSKDVFTVPVNALVICPEEEAAIQDACPGDQCHSHACRTQNPGAMSRSWDMSLDNPWDKLQSVSVTLSSSLEEQSLARPSPLSTQGAQLAKSAEEVAVTQPDSNTPDFLEPPSQKSPCSLSQDEPAETLSPSVLPSHSGSINSRVCHTASPVSRQQTDLDGMASPLGVGNSCLRSAECEDELGSGAGEKDLPKSRKHVVTKRKLLVGGEEAHSEVLPNQGRTHQTAHADVPMERAKKSRMEQAGPAQKPSLPSHPARPPATGNETASAPSMTASCQEQRRAQQQYVKTTPFQYTYKAPSPELSTRVKSTRISKAMLRWACWVLTKAEQTEP